MALAIYWCHQLLMKSPFLQTLRWILMVVLSIVLLFGGYAGISVIASLIPRATDIGGIAILVFMFLMMVFYAAFPATMLYSLATKKLYGFASAIGAAAALVLVYYAITLPSKLGAYAFLDAPDRQPHSLPTLAGIVLCFAFIILPFWAISRMIRLTNTWIYPRLFKPLEDKI